MAGFFSKLLKRNEAEVEPATPPSGDPFDMDWGSGHPTDAVVYQLTSVLMRYPSEETRALLPELTALAEETGNDYLMRGVARIKTWYEAAELDAMQAEYVQEYDLSRRHAFHLSYWTEGDTRRRGEALARFKQMYRDSGMVTTLHGELPDYLPMVLEFTALVDARAGRAALQAYRPSLELLRLALRDDNLPYYELIEAVCQTLPGVSPETQADVQKLVTAGPPAEAVGLALAPGDPRLLPLLLPHEQTPGATIGADHKNGATL
ncbi:nitrate reductase molybdenum cofactor assembly chaperone [Rothia nasimurium]|uniref:nitrate reductase molybdenum cofactor assembly chaperone n=1 Tax=Rothia nasimurium TaxID=85336 RepID=UPI001EFF6832|nr:nitrate reductase molybdenum cofactor assembly chaperone [Rothia nasimurium]